MHPILVRSAAVLLLLGLAAGCSQDREDPGHPLAKGLIERVPGSYEPVVGPSGPMDFDDAITSIGYISPARVRRQLGRTGFQEGYARVWREVSSDEDDAESEGDEIPQRSFITVLVFDFLQANRAKDMVKFVSGELDELRGAQGFEISGITGSRAYTVNAAASRSSDPLFCQVVWFARSTRAYEVRTCDPSPISTEVVEELARRQHRELRP